MPDPYTFSVDVFDSIDQESVKPSVHAALLPHEVVHSLYENARFVFDLIIGSGKDLELFWREAAQINDDWFSSHPVLARARAGMAGVAGLAGAANVSAYGIHGDDAGVHGGEQVSLTAPKSTMIKVSRMIPIW